LNLYEYQVKQLFKDIGIKTPAGQLAKTEDDAINAYQLVGPEVMLKSQVLTGGRGKAGGIKAAAAEEEVLAVFKQLTGLTIKGLPVKQVWVEEKLQIEQEFYVGITISPDEQLPVLIVSSKGGMDVEEVAREFPEAMAQCVIDMKYPLHDYTVREVLSQLNFRHTIAKRFVPLIQRLYDIYLQYHAILLEVNPLVLTVDGELVAADGRLAIDDNALNKYSTVKKLAVETAQDTVEQRMKKYGIDYVELDGNVGIISVGAGETMATMDLISRQGGKPACFLDFSAGVNPETIALALKTVSLRPEVKSILINIFGGLTRIDKVAEGIVYAIKKIGDIKQPLTIRLEGTNAELGREVIQQHGLESCLTLQEAVYQSVKRGEI